MPAKFETLNLQIIEAFEEGNQWHVMAQAITKSSAGKVRAAPYVVTFEQFADNSCASDLAQGNMISCSLPPRRDNASQSISGVIIEVFNGITPILSGTATIKKLNLGGLFS